MKLFSVEEVKKFLVSEEENLYIICYNIHNISKMRRILRTEWPFRMSSGTILQFCDKTIYLINFNGMIESLKGRLIKNILVDKGTLDIFERTYYILGRWHPNEVKRPQHENGVTLEIFDGMFSALYTPSGEKIPGVESISINKMDGTKPIVADARVHISKTKEARRRK